MTSTRFVGLFLFFLLASFSFSHAQNLSDALFNQIDTLPDTAVVRVWIKLPENQQIEKYKLANKAQAVDRATSYRQGIALLKEEHASAQAPILRQLRTMTAQAKSRKIKSYWIANIIDAELSVAEIRSLASTPGIESIYPFIEAKLIEPETSKSDPFTPADAESVTTNISYVKADQAHTLGYTGVGRVVCTFDTGVDGTHPAFASRWKGLNGDSAAAWFDPRYGEKFPHTNPSDFYHGTHVMGILTGRDESLDYTVGVAPQAKWISAAVVDVPGASLFDAFEWAADPDGDPNTIDDLPDVINHSWGFRKAILRCENVFFDAIDNLEMLGIVNIFACGNEGGAYTISNPANRALDSLDNFAVGNLNLSVSPPQRSTSSSRGPSDCDSSSIKPNVMAPGAGIRSTYPGGTYGLLSGTSMAAPHVSGLVALLRQKNPNATVDEIKEAILASTRTESTFGTLPNNEYGWGAIDCIAALNYLDGTNVTPNVRLYDFTHLPINPGDTVVGTLVLQNRGATANNVSAIIIGTDPELTILEGSASFGSIGEGDTVRSDDSIRVVVSPTINEGTILSLDMDIVGTGFTVPSKLYFVVEPQGSKSIADIDNGKIHFTLSNYGIYGMGGSSIFPGGGVGFQYVSDSNNLWEGGLIIGRSPTQVSSGVHGTVADPNNDFKVAPGGDVQVLTPGTKADQEIYAGFNDSLADYPMGIEIRQESYAFDDAANDDYAILFYRIRNMSGSQLDNVNVGLFLDWDIASGSSNAGGYETIDNYLWMAYNDGSSLVQFRGIKGLHGTVHSAQTGNAQDIVYLRYWISTGNGYTQSEKYASLNAGFNSNTTYENYRGDLFQMMTIGPLDLATGQEQLVAFAVIAGLLQTDIADASNAAVAKFAATNWAPAAVSCLAPVGRLTGLEADPLPMFTWTASSDANPSDQIHYLLQVDTNSTFADPVYTADSLTVEAHNPTSPFASDTRYYWRVITYDDQGDSTLPINTPSFIISTQQDTLLVVLPDTLKATAIVGGVNPDPQSFQVREEVNLSIPYLVQFIDPIDWLTLTSSADSTPAMIDVEYDISDLNVGSYFDSVRIVSDDASNSPVYVYFSLEIQSAGFVLNQNRPNPFTDETTIAFETSHAEYYTLTIYNTLGQIVDEYRGQAVAGENIIRWRPYSIASGIYYYRLELAEFIDTKKMIYLK